jgi:hypothetical protein
MHKSPKFTKVVGARFAKASTELITLYLANNFLIRSSLPHFFRGLYAQTGGMFTRLARPALNLAYPIAATHRQNSIISTGHRVGCGAAVDNTVIKVLATFEHSSVHSRFPRFAPQLYTDMIRWLIRMVHFLVWNLYGQLLPRVRLLQRQVYVDDIRNDFDSKLYSKTDRGLMFDATRLTLTGRMIRQMNGFTSSGLSTKQSPNLAHLAPIFVP